MNKQNSKFGIREQIVNAKTADEAKELFAKAESYKEISPKTLRACKRAMEGTLLKLELLAKRKMEQKPEAPVQSQPVAKKVKQTKKGSKK